MNEWYYALDNGHTPFRYNLDKKNAVLFLEESPLQPDGIMKHNDIAKWTSLREVKYSNVWLGGDEKNQDVGHNVLVQTGPRSLLFIGHELLEFELEQYDNVVSFVSYLGNSEVAYPSLQTDKWTYLLNENIRIENVHRNFLQGPYDQYLEDVQNAHSARYHAFTLNQSTAKQT